MAILSEEAKKLGIAVGWDPTTKNVTVGTKTYTPDQLKGAGLTLTGGRWQGDTTSLLNPTPQVAAPVQMVSPQAVAPQVQAPSFDDQILATKKAQTIRDLENMYGKQTGALNSELSTIQPTYAQKKSDVRVQNTLSSADFEKFLMQKGLGQSGSSAQGEIASNIALQGNLGRLDTAEANAVADVEKRRSQLTTDLEYGKQSASGAYDLASLEAQQRASQMASDRAYEESLTNQKYAREDALTAKDDARQMDAKKVEDFISTIGRFYQDFSKQINAVSNDGDPSNDWQIPYLEQAKQDKITSNGLDPRTGKPIPVDNTEQVWDAAYKKWNAGIPLTQQEMQVIGATSAVKPKVVSSGGSGSSTTITQDRNYQEDRWQRLGKADEAIAKAWGVPVGTPFSNKPEETTQANIGEYDDYINTYYRTNTDGINSVDKNGVAMYLVELEKAGKSDEAIELAIKYNISDKTIEEAERILNSRR